MHAELYVNRMKRKESITEVAKSLNITRQSYSKKEKGETIFTLPEAQQLARRYDKTLDELFKEAN